MIKLRLSSFVICYSVSVWLILHILVHDGLVGAERAVKEI